MYFDMLPGCSAVRLDLPDFPRIWVRCVLGVPVAVEPLALRQHPRSDRVHERIEVERHDVVAGDQRPLDLAVQARALLGVSAGLMLLPQLVDLGLADQARGGGARGIDADKLGGATRVDVLNDRPVAWKGLAPLPDLGAERRPFQ